MFQKCPKCGYARAPGDLGSPERCPSCGLIFAKYQAAHSEATDQAVAPVPPAVEERRSLIDRLVMNFKP